MHYLSHIRRIRTREELARVADDLGVAADWHEPDEQGVGARVFGTHLDNAGFWGFWGDASTMFREREEYYVILYKDGEPVAAVNLATLLAWACEVGE